MEHTHAHYTYKVFFDDGSIVEFEGVGTKKDGSELIIVREDGGFVSLNFDRVRWVDAQVMHHAH